jgi:Flp pilus assembly pilin Flp
MRFPISTPNVVKNEGTRSANSAALGLLLNLVRSERGAAAVEYSILVGCVALAGCVGLVVVGVALIDSFEFVRRLILVPTP